MTAQSDLNAAAIAYAVAQGYTAPVPPTPPAPSGAIDDKRAIHCTQISSTGWSYANPAPGVHTLAQSYNGVNMVPSTHPPTDFTFLDFTNNDVTVADDPVYGKVWRMKCGPTSHNPFVDHVQSVGFWYYCHNTNLSFTRQCFTDQGAKSWDWYAFAVKLDPGWTVFPDGALVFECNYPHIASPPFETGWNGSTLTATRAAGMWAGKYPWPISERINLRSYASVAGKWLQYIVGVKWSSHGAGNLVLRTRLQGETAWTTHWNLSGITTWQYSANVPQDANGVQTDDLFGPYEQWNSSYSVHADNFPQHDLSAYAWVRCPTEAIALSYLPA